MPGTRKGAAGEVIGDHGARAAALALARPRRCYPIIEIKGGTAAVGTNNPIVDLDGEGPARQVRLRHFGLSATAVTNAEFAAFVAETGYVTEAERFGWSCVFANFVPEELAGPALEAAPWWVRVDGACWFQPEGPNSSLAERADHPVVHVSLADALNYAEWAGGRLPTEPEWEFAARALRDEVRFPWGDEEPDDDAFLPCNIWQGDFPRSDTAADGYAGTAPVDSFAANPFGLYNMVGNTWEWTADPFRIRSMKREARIRDRHASAQNMRVLKGGSYLCHRSYCYRYRIAARTGSPSDSTTGHVGFRLVFDR